MAGDHDVDRLIELFHDVDDRSRNAGAFIVVARRQSAFVDQDDDGLDAARLQFRDQRVHRAGFVAKFKVGNARRRDQAGCALQGQADEGHGNAVERADFVRRKHGLAGALLERAGGEIAKFRAGEGMRTLAFVDRVAAAVLHPQQLVLAFVEFVIADGGNIQAHHRQRLDRRLVMEHGGQKRAGADQVAGRDEDRVAVSLAKLADQRRHVLGAAGGDGDLLRPVLGIGDGDPARRRAQVAVKIVDRENAQVDRGGGLGVDAAGASMIANARMGRKDLMDSA